jgi:hypothetical protein
VRELKVGPTRSDAVSGSLRPAAQDAEPHGSGTRA